MKKLLVVASYAISSLVLWTVDLKQEQNGHMFLIKLDLNAAEARRPAYRPSRSYRPDIYDTPDWGTKIKPEVWTDIYGNKYIVYVPPKPKLKNELYKKLYDVWTLCAPTGQSPYPFGFGVCRGPELENTLPKYSFKRDYK